MNVQHDFTRAVFIRAFGFTYKSIPRGIVRDKMLNLNSPYFRRRCKDLFAVFKIVNVVLYLNVNVNDESTEIYRVIRLLEPVTRAGATSEDGSSRRLGRRAQYDPVPYIREAGPLFPFRHWKPLPQRCAAHSDQRRR